MEYSAVLAFLVVAMLFGLAGLGFNRLLRPDRPKPVKNAIYGCDIEPTGSCCTTHDREYFQALKAIREEEGAHAAKRTEVQRQEGGADVSCAHCVLHIV